VAIPERRRAANAHGEAWARSRSSHAALNGRYGEGRATAEGRRPEERQKGGWACEHEELLLRKIHPVRCYRLLRSYRRVQVARSRVEADCGADAAAGSGFQDSSWCGCAKGKAVLAAQAEAAAAAAAAATNEAREEEENFAGRRSCCMPDIQAELDDDDTEVVLPPDSAQGVYMKAIYLRLQSETTGEASRSAFQSKWLLDHLKANNWWVRAKKAKLICTKLGLDFSEPSYYRDIRVWIPDLEFGAEAMPPCVSAKKWYQEVV